MKSAPGRPRFRSTTILCVRHGGRVAMAGDGQVSLETTIVKHGARKIRRLLDGKVLAGFAGSAADAFALLTRFEAKLEEFAGNLERASVELAQDWRTDKVLRRLEALLLVADAQRTVLVSGTGDLIEPDDGILAVGSGSQAALGAARALAAHAELSAAEIARLSLEIASTVDVFTNDRIVVEEL